ncbi:MAG: hypothetical protein QOH05_705 [Acetobacteraceae bacterium]|nr:hypothetical protein [Acetobacteraceae bacterium]
MQVKRSLGIPMRVEELTLNGLDAAGAKVEIVYAKRTPDYAVYKAVGRVMVHFADDATVEKSQRTLMAPLTCVRGEINGLIDGWRESTKQRDRLKALRFQRGVADALAAALEHDPNALTMLGSIKSDITEERTSWARFEYLSVASAAAAICVALVCLITSPVFSRLLYPFPDAVWRLWLAAGCGTVGAFFSIAIAIRTRKVRTYLNFRDNASDAILRVFIWSIAAAVAVCLVDLKAITITVGDATVLTDPTKMILYLMFIAFVAGFSERLVPDLLQKAAAGSGNAAPAPTSQPTNAGAGAVQVVGAAQGGAAQAGADNTGSNNTVQEAPGRDRIAAAQAAADDKEDLSDSGIKPHEVTQDQELPAAKGVV